GVEPDRIRVVADVGPPEDARRPVGDVVALQPLEQRQLDFGLIGDRPERHAFLFAVVAQPGAEALVHGPIERCGSLSEYATPVPQCSPVLSARCARSRMVASSPPRRNYIVSRRRDRKFCALEILKTTMPSSSSMSTTCDSASEVVTRLRAHFGHQEFRP